MEYDKNFLYRRYVIKLLQNSGTLYDGKKIVYIDNNYLYNLFSGGMKNTYYNKGFYYKILKSKNKNNYSYKFLIGKSPNCLEATLNYNPKTKITENTVHIQYMQSNIKCGIPNGNNFNYIQKLYNSSSILYSFIQYVKDNYKNVKYITLIDEANYNCNELYNMEKIPLSIYYFLKYMKLYYMKRYNFHIYDYNKNIENKNIKKFKKIVNLYKNEKKMNKSKIKYIINYLKKRIMKIKNEDNYIKELLNEINIIKKLLFHYKEFDIFLQNYRFKNCFVFYYIIKSILNKMNKKIKDFLENIHLLNFRYIL